MQYKCGSLLTYALIDLRQFGLTKRKTSNGGLCMRMYWAIHRGRYGPNTGAKFSYEVLLLGKYGINICSCKEVFVEILYTQHAEHSYIFYCGLCQLL